MTTTNPFPVDSTLHPCCGAIGRHGRDCAHETLKIAHDHLLECHHTLVKAAEQLSGGHLYHAVHICDQVHAAADNLSSLIDAPEDEDQS